MNEAYSVKIENTEEHLKITEEKMKICRKQCRELSFMSMSKIMVVHDILCTNYVDSSDLIPAVGFRYSCDKNSRDTLITAISVSLKIIYHNYIIIMVVVFQAKA